MTTEEGPNDALDSLPDRVGSGVRFTPSPGNPGHSAVPQLAVMNPNEFTFLAHVDPPPDQQTTQWIGFSGDAETVSVSGIFHYIGPRLFPLGVYMPKGYDLESRPGEDGWTILRARCLATGQVMTMWAVGPSDGEHSTVEPDLMEPEPHHIREECPTCIADDEEAFDQWLDNA